jgi:hypothetical protein
MMMDWTCDEVAAISTVLPMKTVQAVQDALELAALLEEMVEEGCTLSVVLCTQTKPFAYTADCLPWRVSSIQGEWIGATPLLALRAAKQVGWGRR